MQMGYEDYPKSIGNVLRRVAKEFKNELVVTENGVPVTGYLQPAAISEPSL